jgi:hypothetical protein
VEAVIELEVEVEVAPLMGLGPMVDLQADLQVDLQADLQVGRPLL